MSFHILFASAALTAAAHSPVQVTDATCRPALAGAPTGACYLTLTAPRDDRLVSVQSPAADHVEIHTMDMADGVMRMRPLPNGVELPAGKPVALTPGGRHLMMIGPKAQMAEGGVVLLTLRFEHAAPVTVRIVIGGRR